jgi:DNA-binding NarL/FixJ family response regulator
MNVYTPDIHDSVLPSPLLIVEDEPVMQMRLRHILQTLGYVDEALFFAGSIAAAQALLIDEAFAMALIDVGLPDGNGIDLIQDLHGRDNALPILVISAWRSEQVIVGALQAGATGYLLKERDDMEIALSIRSALRGGAPIDPFIAKRILALIGQAASDDRRDVVAAAPLPVPLNTPLSPREIQILGFVGKGLTNREIAGLLTLSKLTVECHIKNIYKKLAVGSRTEAVYEARAHGLLP